MKIIVPILGGKDSTCCLLLAIKKVGKDNVLPVFNDTGWEHPETYKYLKYLEERLKVKIYKTKGRNILNKKHKGQNIPDLIRSYGRFPAGRVRFYTQLLKQESLRDWYKKNIFNPEKKYEIWFGMRKVESWQRRKKYEKYTHYDTYSIIDMFPGVYNKKLSATIAVRLPIIEFETNTVFNFLQKNNVKKNPLYDEGTNDRVGCYPCLLAGKKKQAAMFATDFGKKQLEIIKKLEIEIGKKYEMFDTGYKENLPS